MTNGKTTRSTRGRGETHVRLFMMDWRRSSTVLRSIIQSRHSSLLLCHPTTPYSAQITAAPGPLIIRKMPSGHRARLLAYGGRICHSSPPCG
jgi:hypothetical protein